MSENTWGKHYEKKTYIIGDSRGRIELSATCVFGQSVADPADSKG